jgi:Zn-dependent protease
MTEPRPQDSPGSPRTKSKSPWAIGATLLVLLSKAKFALFFLLKAAKPLWTVLLTVGIYAFIYPWTFAVGFVALIFVHEMGHMWAARRKGMPVTAPFFIPFIGAAIFMKRNPKDAETEAFIGIAGPIFGTVGALVCYSLGAETGYEIWYGLAYVGFLLNLINLLPLHPLDGGRIVTAVTRWLWIVGVALGPIVIWRFQSIIFLYIWLLFLWEMYKKFFRDRGGAKIAVQGTFSANRDPALPAWFMQGEAHERELPFTAYCTMDGEHRVAFSWDALSVQGELAISQACLIHRVSVTKVNTQRPDIVTFNVKAEGVKYEPENYYDVPMRTRIRMGLLYGGLLAFLIYMIWQMGDAGLVRSVIA